ncbi:MAG: hypothetical protein IJ446_06060 [Oscillospiraceae bacterium]|nr:hypothetical protein [Oscillospiraceae bacterium]
MAEYLQLTDNATSEESAAVNENIEKSSFLLDLMIFRTVIGIIVATGFLVMRMVSPDTASEIQQSFHRLSGTSSPADRFITETAGYISDFFAESPVDNAEKVIDRA